MYETNSKISEILLVNQVPAWLLLVFSESVLCKLCECKHVLALPSLLLWPRIPPLLVVKLLKEPCLCHPEA